MENCNTKSNSCEFKEPKIGWQKLKARKLLYQDVAEGRVHLEAIIDGKRTTDYAAVYAMHAEYSEWDFEKFSCRLAGIRKIIEKNIERESEKRPHLISLLKTIRYQSIAIRDTSNGKDRMLRSL